MVTRGLLWLWLGLWLAVPAGAQEGPTFIQFSFSNPGARSLGFGGAFVALADDATAAFANPAGLVQLARPEVSIEGRYWRHSTPFTAGGRLEGAPTGIGRDDTAGLRFGVSERDLSGVSFLSAVYPVKSGSFAFYRHQLANFESLAVSNGLYGKNGRFETRFPDLRTTTDLDVVTYGLAAGFRASETFNWGLGLAYHEVDFVSLTEAFDYERTFDAFFAPNPLTPERLTNVFTLADQGADLTINLGFLWKPRPRWSLGGVYRMGFEFELNLVQVSGASGSVPAGTILLDRNDLVDAPTVWGLGLAYRSKGDALTISFEWDRVEYSSMVSDLDPTLFDKRGLELADADELHAGLEYAFLRSKPLIAIRLGAWLDPDHRIRIGGERSAFDRAIFQPGDDEVHVSAGVGLVFERFQVDLAVDFSDLVDTASLSAIYHF